MKQRWNELIELYQYDLTIYCNKSDFLNGTVTEQDIKEFMSNTDTGYYPI